ncbi:MAG: VWA domain-containing protein [Bryobacteraceae bacterium]|jgi:VWFA-related protein
MRYRWGKRHHLLGLAAAWICAAALLAQETPVLNVLQTEADVKGRVKLLVSVTDAKGRGIAGLGAANFEVAVEGEQVRDARFERGAGVGSPLSVILALDVSGSMRGEAIEAAKISASEFLDRLGKEDYCALMVFGDDVRLAADFTRDRQVTRRVLAELQAADSTTHLYQALFDSVKRVGTAPTPRSAIVVLTDGKDEGSSLGVEDVISRVSAAAVPIYTLGYGTKADVKLLGRVSTLSGGVFYYTPNAEELRRTYAAIVDQINNEYLLSFTIRPPSVAQKPGTVILKLGRQPMKRAFVVEGIPEKYPRWAFPAGLVAMALVVVVAALFGVRWYRQRHAMQETIAMRPMSQPGAWLEVTRGPHTGQRYPLRGDSTTVGRVARSSQFCLKNDPLLTSAHLRITRNDAGQYVIEDLGSKNGTKVNEVDLAGALVLQPNDRIQIGLSELLYLENR